MTPPSVPSHLAALRASFAPKVEPPRHAGWASPAAFAASCSEWRPARHLQVIEDAVLAAIDTGGTVVIEVPIRHGKSWYCSRWLPAWYLGRFPDKKIILGAHSQSLAEQWGGDVRGILDEHGPTVFGVSVSKSTGAKAKFEIAGHGGGMLARGVGGGVVGWGGDLIVLDDPYAGFLQAMSPTIRDRVIDWWVGSIRGRREPGGAVVILCARWHEDDLPGFVIRESRNVTRVRMPGLCDDEEGDPLGRKLGEPLWPERWSLAELDDLRHDLSTRYGESVWLAQVQQAPATPTGGLFRPDRWEEEPAFTIDLQLQGRWVRGWDLAGSFDRGDWTVGVLMGRLPGTAQRPEGRFVIADVVRGRWDPAEVRAMVRSTAASDPKGTIIAVPQDPAQAGKDQADQYRRMLQEAVPGAQVVQRPVTPGSGSKETRAGGYSSQHLAGNVALIDGPWSAAFVAEHTGFPRGNHDDQVDAAAEAYNVLVGEAGAVVTSSSYRDDRLRGRR